MLQWSVGRARPGRKDGLCLREGATVDEGETGDGGIAGCCRSQTLSSLAYWRVTWANSIVLTDLSKWDWNVELTMKDGTEVGDLWDFEDGERGGGRRKGPGEKSWLCCLSATVCGDSWKTKILDLREEIVNRSTTRRLTLSHATASDRGIDAVRER